jgi:hypothetical protein
MADVSTTRRPAYNSTGHALPINIFKEKNFLPIGKNTPFCYTCKQISATPIQCMPSQGHFSLAFCAACSTGSAILATTSPLFLLTPTYLRDLREPGLRYTCFAICQGVGLYRMLLLMLCFAVLSNGSRCLEKGERTQEEAGSRDGLAYFTPHDQHPFFLLVCLCFCH